MKLIPIVGIEAFLCTPIDTKIQEHAVASMHPNKEGSGFFVRKWALRQNSLNYNIPTPETGVYTYQPSPNDLKIRSESNNGPEDSYVSSEDSKADLSYSYCE
jgi:hypothetical protein